VPLIRKTESIVGKQVVGDVTKFVRDNAEALEREAFSKKEKFEMTLEESAKHLSHAIAYGISKVLSHQLVSTAFAQGICPVGGDVPPYQVGNKIFDALNGVTKEKS